TPITIPSTPPSAAWIEIAAMAAPKVSAFGMRRVRRSDTQARMATATARNSKCIIGLNLRFGVRHLPQAVHPGRAVGPTRINRADRPAEQVERDHRAESKRARQECVLDQVLTVFVSDEPIEQLVQCRLLERNSHPNAAHRVALHPMRITRH